MRHRVPTMPWMREMWLLLLQMNSKAHSRGSCRSTLAPAEHAPCLLILDLAAS